MKVLIAASECSPLVKVGGIADVIGSLPIALKQLGVDVRVAIPYYKPLHEKIHNDSTIKTEEVLRFKTPYGDKEYSVIIYETVIPNTDVPVYLIYNEEILSNGGVYYSPTAMPSTQDELIRFAFFSRTISDAFTYPDSIFHPDVMHLNDWHTGLVPQIVQSTHRYNTTGLPRTVFTIHNLAYQGFSSIDVAEKVGIDIATNQTVKWDTADDNLDFVLQGIVGADFITTVSEHYAKEILTPEYGEGLDEILKARESRIIGILNGISYEVFNPLTDKMIYKNYSKANVKEGKAENKARLQMDLGLDVNPNKPILAAISRLADQKGLDLIADKLPEILEMGYQFVLLGTGDPQLEALFKDFKETHPQFTQDYSPNITFSEDLARKIYSASDMFVIPSRFEPCGLTQMIAMKYGSVPVVRATGGLYDTVHDNTTGFTFDDLSSDALLNALQRAFVTYSSDKNKWASMVNNCVNQDFSWNKSAQKYTMLYKKTLAL